MMPMRTLLFIFSTVLAAAAYAQDAVSPAEISFWETVRDSRNPAELQAYIDAYPNGRFVVLAKARLAALGRGPAAQPGPPPVSPPPPSAATPAPVVTGEKHAPAAGDTWTYRLTYPRLRGQWGKTSKPARIYVVTATQASASAVTDELSIDGGPPMAFQHDTAGVLVQQGASIFSPYFSALGGRLGSVQSAEPACNNAYACTARVRSAGSETVTVPAGRFMATKYVVDQTWRPVSGSYGRPGDTAQMNGGRTLTIWYAQQVGRAVKFQSRLIVGDMPPMDDPDFDLELVSYPLKTP